MSLGLSDSDSEGVCDHCHLPLPRPWRRRRAPVASVVGRCAAGFSVAGVCDPGPGSQTPATEERTPRYCCFGCRLAAAVAHERGEEGAARRTLTRLGLAIFFAMNVMAFTMALWTSDVYRAESSSATPLAETLDGLFRHLVLLFAVPVLILLGWPLWENAREAIKRGMFSTDWLIVAGVAASFAYSAVSVVRGDGPVYFEVGCVVLVMVTLGRWLEATGKLKANDSLDRLARLMPATVRRVRDGAEEEVPLSAIAKGDLLRVLAGERIPADARVLRGLAFLDEQVLTGESAPILRQERDSVLGGTLNLDGDLLIEVAAAGSEGILARLIELVRRARTAQGTYELLAERVSAWFVPFVTAIALATFLLHGIRSGWEHGLLQGLAVVLIACPCALGLATPLAVWSALGRAAGAQVLFRSGEALERLAGARAVRFDKTGTLTTGEATVSDLAVDRGDDRAEVLARAGLLAASSSHVLARAILRFTAGFSTETPGIVADVRTFAGRGVTALIAQGGTTTLAALGHRRLLEENGLTISPALELAARLAESQGRTISWVGWDGRARGVFAFLEQLRPSARAALASCRALGLDVGVLTGDHPARGAVLSRELGLPVEAALLPEQKVEAIREARRQFGPVVMVGDGVNDAPALAASGLGVALGCGTDLSRESAAVCLLGDDLERLPWAIAHARRTLGVIRRNLAWAFGYNTFGVACAAVGWLSPALAALLMVGSSAVVIVNSLKLSDPGPSSMRDASVVTEKATLSISTFNPDAFAP